jgi:hypothetical protein
MNPPTDDDITELAALDVMKISGVDTPANGTPWLLLKSAAPSHAQHEQGETKVKSPQKAAAKAAKQAVARGIKTRRKSFAATQAVAAQKSAVRNQATAAIAGRMARIQKLESALKSGLPDATEQDRRIVAGEISFQKLAAARELAAHREWAALNLAPSREASASQAATASAQGNATGTPINARRGQAEAQLRSVFGQTYTSESLDRDQTELPSQMYGVGPKPVPPADFGEIGEMTKRLRTLKKQLSESRDPLELQRLGDQITLLQLTRAHMTGVA